MLKQPVEVPRRYSSKGYLMLKRQLPPPCSRFLERLIIMKELEKNSCSRVVALATSASVTEDAAAVVAETVAVADVQSRK